MEHKEPTPSEPPLGGTVGSLPTVVPAGGATSPTPANGGDDVPVGVADGNEEKHQESNFPDAISVLVPCMCISHHCCFHHHHLRDVFGGVW
jgi:hypothetical protein